MGLTIIATPIGNYQDISLRALQVLTESEIVFCESTKETSKLLKQHNITQKKYFEVSEHTTDQELNDHIILCHEKKCALVSDCGTPGFCDPGFQLIKLCRQRNIPVTALPGPSSLMFVISLASEKIKTFYFRGFLPAENLERSKQLNQLKKINEPIILMDTPYRFKKMRDEIQNTFPNRKTLWVINATQETEQTVEVLGKDISKHSWSEKAEFIVLVY